MSVFSPARCAVVIILILPLVLPNALLTIYVFIGLSIMVVSGLSLLMGFAGQVSLGQAAFYAIGAYTAGLLDYLSDARARQLIEKLYGSLAPSGRLLVSNFLPRYEGRAFMEHFMDWPLICRSTRSSTRSYRWASSALSP